MRQVNGKEGQRQQNVDSARLVCQFRAVYFNGRADVEDRQAGKRATEQLE